jgi:hypothetical protein
MGEYVVVVTLPGTLEHFTKKASGKLSIGRSDDCDIWLSYPTVSRPHAEIDYDADGRFLIRDLASRNGTTVNGRMIKDEEIVVDGKTTVLIGPYVLTLSAESEAEDTVTIATRQVPTRLKLDRGIHALVFGDEVLIERLSSLEYRLIDLLDAHAPNVVENTVLGDKLWGEGQWDVYMLHNLVRRIRRKLGEVGLDAEEHFITVPGVGYRLA